MSLHCDCCYLCLTRVTQRKNNGTPCGKIKVPKKTWFLPRGKYTQYCGATAGHDALSDSGNPNPLALVCTQQSKMTHLLRSQTRSKIFHVFLYSLELQSSVIQRKHPYTIFLIFKRMCKYFSGQMWQSLSACALFTLPSQTLNGSSGLTHAQGANLTLFHHRLWLPVHISFLIWHQNNTPVTLHVFVLCFDYDIKQNVHHIHPS